MNTTQMNKYNIFGTYKRANGWQMSDCLCFLRDTESEAIAICRELYPDFDIDTVEIEYNWNGDKEVPRIQSLV